MAAQAEAIAAQFVSQYYQTFDTNRAGLRALYGPNAVMMFEGKTCVGPDAIMEKLMSMQFQTIQHSITTRDFTLIGEEGLLIMVMGQLKSDNDPVQSFSQTFYLKQIGNSLFVMNDIFRLTLHHVA